MKILLLTSLAAASAAAFPVSQVATPPAQERSSEAQSGRSQLHPRVVATEQEARRRDALEARLDELRLRRFELHGEAEKLEVRMELEVVQVMAERRREHRARLRELEQERAATEREAERRERDLMQAHERLEQELARLRDRSGDPGELRRALEAQLRRRDEHLVALERALERIPSEVETSSGRRVPNPEYAAARQRNEDQRRDIDAELAELERAFAEAREREERARQLEEERDQVEQHGRRVVEELHERMRALEHRGEELHEAFELDSHRFELERELERRAGVHELERAGLELELEMERVERALEELGQNDRRTNTTASRADGRTQLRAVPPTNDEPIVVVDDLEAARARARAEGRPLLVNFTGHTCVNGRLMEAQVFQEPAIASVLAGFVEARLHADAPDDEVRARVARHAETIARSGALPVYVVLDPRTGAELARHEGAMLEGGKKFGRFLETARARMKPEARQGEGGAEDALLEAVQALRDEVALLRAELQRRGRTGGGR